MHESVARELPTPRSSLLFWEDHKIHLTPDGTLSRSLDDFIGTAGELRHFDLAHAGGIVIDLS